MRRSHKVRTSKILGFKLQMVFIYLFFNYVPFLIRNIFTLFCYKRSSTLLKFSFHIILDMLIRSTLNTKISVSVLIFCGIYYFFWRIIYLNQTENSFKAIGFQRCILQYVLSLIITGQLLLLE